MRKKDIKNIIKLYKSGLSINDIAKKLYFSRGTVYNTLKSNNITLRDKFKVNIRIRDKIVPLYNSGLSINDIAKKLNINNSTIYATLHKHNTVLRDIVKGESKNNIKSKKHISRILNKYVVFVDDNNVPMHISKIMVKKLLMYKKDILKYYKSGIIPKTCIIPKSKFKVLLFANGSFLPQRIVPEFIRFTDESNIVLHKLLLEKRYEYE